MKLGALALSLSLVAVAADPADACSLFFNEPIQGQAAPGDVTAPQLTVGDWEIAWHATEGTCAERGHLAIDVSATDGESSFGFVVEVVDGNMLQEDFGTEPMRPGSTSGDTLHYYFDYDLTPIQATLHVRAVDLAGNRSEPVEIVIDDARSEDDEESGGCAAGGGGGGFGALMLAALALVGARRRARR